MEGRWSGEEVHEVSFHNLLLFLLHSSSRIVRRENQINFATKRVDTNNPEVSCVLALLQAIFRVLLKLQVHLVQNVLQVKRKHIL